MIVMDCEWPINQPDKIWMVGALHVETNCYTRFDSPDALDIYLTYYDEDEIVGHYFIFADMPRLRKCWGIDLSNRTIYDTWTMGSFYKPRPEDNAGQSLKAWGGRIGEPKLDFTDFDEPAEGETQEEWWARMATYLEQDVKTNWEVYRYLHDLIEKAGMSFTALACELRIAKIVQQQIENGFFFDMEKATQLYVRMTSAQREVKQELQKLFPPIVIDRGEGKSGRKLKDKVIEFNPGSRQQIATRLQAKGVQFKHKTPGGAVKIDEEVLATVPLPEAAKIAEYLMLDKRISQLDQWFKYYRDDTGCIHGGVNPLGTNTHRQTQSSPNLAQIPSLRVPYGRQCRELFTVPEECKLVGVDASSLELRLLANRLQDPDFKQEVESGDVHTANMQRAGLHDRDQAKTFIYAFIYGARDPKLAQILKCSVAEAGAIRKRFLDNLPAFAEFKERTEKEAKETGLITLLDGSRVWCDSPHRVLNYQLQGDGAVVMKRGLCIAMECLKDTSAKLVVQAHDEWQFQTAFYDCDLVGKLCVKSLEKVSEVFNMYVQLTGEYKVGRSWADTH